MSWGWRRCNVCGVFARYKLPVRGGFRSEMRSRVPCHRMYKGYPRNPVIPAVNPEDVGFIPPDPEKRRCSGTWVPFPWQRSHAMEAAFALGGLDAVLVLARAYWKARKPGK